MEPFNGLTPAQVERLAVLSEELGEAQQRVGKILRHGYTRSKKVVNNREQLEIELGDVMAAISVLVRYQDLRLGRIRDRKHHKLQTVWDYLHHNKKEDVYVSEDEGRPDNL